MQNMQTNSDITLQNDAHFRELLTALPNVSVQGYDKERRVIYWNRASELLYGYTEAEAMGNLLEDLIIPAHMRSAVVEAHQAWLQQGIAIPASELELQNKQQETVPVYSSHVMLYQNTDDPEMYCVDVNLSEQRKQEQKIEYLTQFDKQTGLHNKDSLFRYLKNALVNQSSADTSYSALFIGIDDLTHINNAYGYKTGDELILELVTRLQNSVRQQDFIARYSGDIFVIILAENKPNDHLSTILTQLKEAGRKPYTFEQELRQVTVSVGISTGSTYAPNPVQLLTNAESAMNHAKVSGKNKHVYYESELDNKLQRSYSILTALSTAIELNEFTLVYQPQYDQQGKIISCEALLRWHNKKLGHISPIEFIPLAESKNKIKIIDTWVVSSAIKQIKKWLEQSVQPVRIFINLSGQSLSDETFIDTFISTLEQANVPYDKLGIEITEYALISESNTLIKQIKNLQDKGVIIALDDFGTGYSSLSYLTKFPLNVIKIDKYFIANAPDNSQAAAITKAIFALSYSLGMKVICEGVENKKQQDFISQQTNEELMQGYLFSRPIDASEIEKLFQTTTFSPYLL